MIVNPEGIIACVAWYLLTEEDLVKLFKEEKRLFIAARKALKRLITKEQHELFKRRSVIEYI